MLIVYGSDAAAGRLRQVNLQTQEGASSRTKRPSRKSLGKLLQSCLRGRLLYHGCNLLIGNDCMAEHIPNPFIASRKGTDQIGRCARVNVSRSCLVFPRRPLLIRFASKYNVRSQRLSRTHFSLLVRWQRPSVDNAVYCCNHILAFVYFVGNGPTREEPSGS